MNTDKQLFQLFSACPEWLFELAGLPPPGASELRSFTVKELERRTDGLIVPKDPSQPLTIVEFQFSRDDTIYRRTVSEMIAAQEEFGGRLVRGMIFFGSRRYDPRTPPWNQIVQSFVIDDVVAEFQKTHPRHPLTAVFQPLVESRDRILESTAIEHFRTIQRSSLSARRKALLSAVFVSWLEQRFPKKGKREIEIMLLGELPPLEETQSGKDLIQIGVDRGHSQGLTTSLLTVAEARFGSVPRTLQSRVHKLSPDECERLLHVVATCESLADVRAWLSREKK